MSTSDKDWGSKAYSMLEINLNSRCLWPGPSIEKLIKFWVRNQSEGMSGIFKITFRPFLCILLHKVHKSMKNV